MPAKKKTASPKTEKTGNAEKPLKNKDKKSGKKQRLILLDTHAILHRAYHAMPDFSTASGEPTGGLYGLSTMLFKIVDDLKPDYIVAAYDLPKKTFRHEVYAGYKAGRKTIDDALRTQLTRSRELLEDFGIPVYACPGFEADDMLGTIVEQLKDDKNIEVYIATGDMDTLQLVDKKRVKVFTLRKGITDTVVYDEDAVNERYGFGPEHITDFKGLRGDPSDNIIGVPGVGEKTATILIKEFGALEDMYKVLKKTPEKVKAAGLTDRIVNLLLEHEEEAIFSKTLATISRNAPVGFKLPAKTWQEGVDPARLEKVFNDLEFRSLVPRARKMFGTNDSAGVRVESTTAKDEVDKTAIALWLVNSDLTDAGESEVLSYAKTDNFEKAKDKIMKDLHDEKLDDVYNEIELPIYPIVKKMEEFGVGIDKKVFSDLSKKYHKRIDELEKKAWELAGEEFNLASPKQLAEILFTKLGLKRKTRTSKVSTKAEVLAELEDAHPNIPLIMEHRELSKLVGTYIDTIPEMVGADGRLHARFIQNGTTTGRFGSADPNLQNIPIRTDAGREIRKGMIAAKNRCLISLDYSQIELRVMAILSGDKELIKIFQSGADVHSGVAARVFNVDEADVTREMRRRAKIINFGIIYGMGVTALQKNLGSSRAEAQDFHDKYFALFTGVRDFIERTKAFAGKHYFTETLFGRKRRFPALRSPIPYLRQMAERMAANAPLQGTQSDIIKLAIRFADEDLRAAGLDHKRTNLILQIHDELVYEVDSDIAEQAEKVIRAAMETALERSYIHYKSPVPVIVSSGVGETLYDLK
jgi:DNA polymerase I-like protein with 3'-5' exonuclease and polymerase domains